MAFIAVTLWWLTQDRSIPIYDVGDQLETAIEYHAMLQSGNLLGPLGHAGVYPILVHSVGAVAMLVGGVNVYAPVVGENIVFVPLLTLGCYQIGRRLYGPLAGMLAVVFALGSPLLASLFHVFLLDAPLTALLAVSVWLILASEHFSRVRLAALAGLAVGLGLNVKVQFALYVTGLVVIVLANGGWRNRRGLATFAAMAFVIGAPWYLIHVAELPTMLELAGGGPGTPAGNVPPTLSIDNFTWYFWDVVNYQLWAPLCAFVLAGALWTAAAIARGHHRCSEQLEFLAGGFLAWLALTLTPHHDVRYGLALLVFLAILGSAWITQLPRAACLAACLLLASVVVANVLGIDFGVGREVKVALADPLPTTEQESDRVIIHSTAGFLVAAPRRDGDVPGLLQALYHEGVRTVAWAYKQTESAEFSHEGLTPLALMNGLKPMTTPRVEFSYSSQVATLLHTPVTARMPPTCTRLSDGTGVLVVRYEVTAGELALYCPSRRPQFYDLGSVG